MKALADVTFPSGTPDGIELHLRRLAYLRGAVLRQAPGVDEEQSRRRPDGKLLPLIHLIDETARHAGHTDAVRELLDGTVGE